jgi:hypothetical protein
VSPVISCINIFRLRILTWEMWGRGAASGVFDDDVGENFGAETEEIMVPLGWEHASGCPPEVCSVESLADLLLASLVAWPDVIALALPEHAPGLLQKKVAADLGTIFASRYPPALIILAGPTSFIRDFELQAPASPHVKRVQEMEGAWGEGSVTVIYKSAPSWVGRGSVLGDVSGEMFPENVFGITQGRGCVLVGNGPSLNVMTDNDFSNSSNGTSSNQYNSALHLLSNVTCVVGANKFWLGSSKFGFQPSIFVAQDVHVMQVPMLLTTFLFDAVDCAIPHSCQQCQYLRY